MSVVVQTGTRVEVLYDFNPDGTKRFLGIRPWNQKEVIHVSNPRALADVLIIIAKECGL